MAQQQQPVAGAQQPFNPEPEYTRNLMVNYIPTTVDEVQIRSLFERCGPIESVKIVCDRDTRQSRGYGFVKYQSAASAQQAINEFNGFSLINKRLKVALAASGNQRQRNNNGGGAPPVRQPDEHGRRWLLWQLWGLPSAGRLQPSADDGHPAAAVHDAAAAATATAAAAGPAAPPLSWGEKT
ncbi:RNA recognition motif. (a.k.a. RRM, RBD, or RNP domain), putative [Angomonas deanei]|uniref:RNA recognition motif. (A.k.a. RRM, RBD, or RNP domain), putative n=1 Tax=Angomonas deanei TaxID=59799 RepID=A0A7G2CCL3_9TRYP|nr:RNA recognition motif. (a.k.a. RRM, RBD, or RNP domain), putative [Angomonas deanei]